MFSKHVIFPYQQLLINRLIWLCIATVIALEAAAIYLLNVTFNFPYLRIGGTVLATCLIIMAFYRYIKRDDGIMLMVSIVTQLACGSFAISIGTYLGAHVHFALTDKAIIASEALVGVDWRHYVAWIDEHPQIAQALDYAYNSCILQFALLLPLLYYNRLAHGQRVNIVMLLTGLLAISLSVLFPVLGGYVYYNIDIHSMFNSAPSAPPAHEHVSQALSTQQQLALLYPDQGIIQFPLYRSIIGVILIYAALPYRFLLPLSVPFNLAMIAAAPFETGQYPTNILCGITVALISIAAATRLLPAVSLRGTRQQHKPIKKWLP